MKHGKFQQIGWIFLEVPSGLKNKNRMKMVGKADCANADSQVDEADSQWQKCKTLYSSHEVGDHLVRVWESESFSSSSS